MATDLNSGETYLYDFSHVPDRDNPDIAMWVTNVLSLNEWRTSRRMEPVEGGDVVFYRHHEMAAKFIAQKIEEAGLPVPTSIPVPLEVSVEMSRRLGQVKILDDASFGSLTAQKKPLGFNTEPHTTPATDNR